MRADRSITNLTSLKTAVPEPSDGDHRTNKRFLSQQVKLTFLGYEHVALNWSLGGVLVEDRHPNLALGTSVSGVLLVRGVEGRFRFSAELVRRDKRTKELAFRFLNPSRALIDVLTRVTE